MTSSFNPKTLSVTTRSPANFYQPVNGRKYTLTHSDETGQFFLEIGHDYSQNSINRKIRDEILVEWQKDWKDRLSLLGKAYVDGGEFSEEMAAYRFDIFKKEMDTSLKAIIYGDLPFYRNYSILLDAPIIITFHSAYPQFRQTVPYGTPREYLKQILG
ncbi:staygreen family protein [Bacillus carboniphilus]|uniref:Staygreen family protein n=1 Tax=Bacillus carboniphilus TaxID=86663 RepID=A0ABP3G7B6_9BACI